MVKRTRILLADDHSVVRHGFQRILEAQEDMETDYHGAALDIGFNVNYLLDVLNNVASEIVELRLADSNSSALMTLPENERFKYVVMPMRI